METSLHEFVLLKLESAKGHWPIVAAGSGVPKRTIEKIARQETRNPGIKHIEALAEYFRKAAQWEENIIRAKDASLGSRLPCFAPGVGVMMKYLRPLGRALFVARRFLQLARGEMEAHTVLRDVPGWLEKRGKK